MLKPEQLAFAKNIFPKLFKTATHWTAFQAIIRTEQGPVFTSLFCSRGCISFVNTAPGKQEECISKLGTVDTWDAYDKGCLFPTSIDSNYEYDASKKQLMQSSVNQVVKSIKDSDWLTAQQLSGIMQADYYILTDHMMIWLEKGKASWVNRVDKSANVVCKLNDDLKPVFMEMLTFAKHSEMLFELEVARGGFPILHIKIPSLKIICSFLCSKTKVATLNYSLGEDTYEINVENGSFNKIIKFKRNENMQELNIADLANLPKKKQTTDALEQAPTIKPVNKPAFNVPEETNADTPPFIVSEEDKEKAKDKPLYQGIQKPSPAPADEQLTTAPQLSVSPKVFEEDKKETEPVDIVGSIMTSLEQMIQDEKTFIDSLKERLAKDKEMIKVIKAALKNSASADMQKKLDAAEATIAKYKKAIVELASK